MSKKWMGLCSMAVVFMLVESAVARRRRPRKPPKRKRSKKSATDVAEAVGMQAVGSYMAQLPAADTPGRMIMLSLNGDNTASMSVDFKTASRPRSRTVRGRGTSRECGST